MDNGSHQIAGALQRVERYIYLGAGVLLALAAVGLLVAAIIEMIDIAMEQNAMRATVHLLDRVLLALMLAEVMYTITKISRRRQITVEPFLIIGVIAAVRRILVITAEASDNVNLSDPHFQAVLAELALLALIILVMAFSLRLLDGVDTDED